MDGVAFAYEERQGWLPIGLCPPTTVIINGLEMTSVMVGTMTHYGREVRCITSHCLEIAEKDIGAG